MLHRRSLLVLGEIVRQRETLDGVPCRRCEAMALERAEPPSDPSVDVAHSKCALCKDEMSGEEFGQWCERYASWARGAAIQVCRRCSLGRCADCSWGACACTEGEHPRRRAAA